MPTYTGQYGIIKTASNTINEVKSFSIDVTADTVDATYQGLDWKENKSIQKSWAGSLTALWDNSDSGQAELVIGSTVTLTLQPAGTSGTGVANEFTGDAIINSISYPSDMASMIEASISFTGTGALTESVSS